jgi:hypothetical protein
MFPTQPRSVRRDQALLRIIPLRATKPTFDPAICSHCDAVWRKGAWALDPFLNRAYGGTLRIRLSPEDILVRIHWRRDSGRSVA